jgi:hypothetical protein
MIRAILARTFLSLAVALALLTPAAQAAQLRIPPLAGATATVRLVDAADHSRQILGWVQSEWADVLPARLALDAAQILTLDPTAAIATTDAAATCYLVTVSAPGRRTAEHCVQLADTDAVQELAALSEAATIPPGSVLGQRLPPDPSDAADGLLVGTLGGGYVLSAAPPDSGTVTSVAISGADGLEVDSGSPITSAGTITLGLDYATLAAGLSLSDYVLAANIGTAAALDATPAAGQCVQWSAGGDLVGAGAACGTETDPVFGAAPAAGITAGDIADWGTAYGWGDHSAAGYLTAESDTAALAAIGALGPGDVGAEPAGVSAADITDATTAGRAVLTAADAAAQRAELGTDAAGAARPPSAHAASHATDGADPLVPADIGAATAAQGALADSAVQPGDDAGDLGSGAAADGYVLAADGAGGAAWEAASGGGAAALTPVDIDCTGGELVAGELARLDLSGCTADVELSLPASPADDARFGALITGTHESHEAYIAGGLVGVSEGATRIWQVGERWEICYCAGGYVARIDGRIMQRATLTSESTAAWASGANINPDWDAAEEDRGGIVDLAGNRVMLRRDGTYLARILVLSASGSPAGAQASTGGAFLRDQDGGVLVSQFLPISFTSRIGLSGSAVVLRAAGEGLLWEIAHYTGTTRNLSGSAAMTRFFVEELR